MMKRDAESRFHQPKSVSFNSRDHLHRLLDIQMFVYSTLSNCSVSRYHAVNCQSTAIVAFS